MLEILKQRAALLAMFDMAFDLGRRNRVDLAVEVGLHPQAIQRTARGSPSASCSQRAFKRGARARQPRHDRADGHFVTRAICR